MVWIFLLVVSSIVFAAPPERCDRALDSAQTERSDFLRTESAMIEGEIWEHSGVQIVSHPGVFPPQLGSGSADTATQVLSVPEPQKLRLLDLGTGSGFLGMVARRAGFKSVLCTDRHLPALDAAAKNAALNDVSIELRRSDLFQNIRADEVFDVILYNFFYYPETGPELFGPARDGGRDSLVAFFKAVPPHLAPGGRILIPFAEFGGPTNDPQTLASNLGYRVTVLHERIDAKGWHRVYQIDKPPVPGTSSSD